MDLQGCVQKHLQVIAEFRCTLSLFLLCLVYKQAAWGVTCMVTLKDTLLQHGDGPKCRLKCLLQSFLKVSLDLLRQLKENFKLDLSAALQIRCVLCLRPSRRRSAKCMQSRVQNGSVLCIPKLSQTHALNKLKVHRALRVKITNGFLPIR